MALSSMVAAIHIWLFNFKIKLIKILKFQFLSHINHLSSAQPPYVPSGYHIRQHDIGLFFNL